MPEITVEQNSPTVHIEDTSAIVEIQEQSVEVTTVEEQIAVIAAAEQGPAGPTGQQGIKGDKGDKGDPGQLIEGTGDASYLHRQEVSDAIWTIEHNLGKIPSVTVVDSGGSLVWGDISYPDLNTVVLTFTSEFTGKAYLN